jgi:hypothetical protein
MAASSAAAPMSNPALLLPSFAEAGGSADTGADGAA